ncbi:MFS transporter [bacterium]|nr:MFS transporter [bacterium]
MNSLDPSDSHQDRTLSTAWMIVLLLLPVAMLNYLDRQMLAAMKTSVMGDIPTIVNSENWGYMLGQFKWVYALLSPLGGFIADRFSRRWTICASLAAWSVVTWLTGQVTTYDGLLWTRTAMGISEAFYMPAALALIADHHLGTSRSKAVGVHHTGIYGGMILGGFAGYAADNPDIGWRAAFNLTGLLGVIYAVPLLWLLRDAPKRTAESLNGVDVPSRPISPMSAGRELLSNPSFLLLVLYFTLPALAGWVVKDWMPSILKERFSIGQGIAGVSATTYVNIASLFGVAAGGWWADRWAKRTARGRIYVSAIGTCLLIPALFGVGNAGTLSVAILFLIVFGLGFGFFDGNNMPILSQIVRPELRATGYGLMNMLSISGGGFADWGFGILSDRGVPLNITFGIFGGIALFSVLLVLLIRPTINDGGRP